MIALDKICRVAQPPWKFARACWASLANVRPLHLIARAGPVRPTGRFRVHARVSGALSHPAEQ